MGVKMEVNLVEIVDKMIGKYNYYGETNADCESYKNLDEVDVLLRHLLTVLAENAKEEDSYMASVAKIARKSRRILEYYGEILEEVGIKVNQ